MSLKEQYETVCAAYVAEFALKQGFTDFFWVGDQIGEVACFADYFFDFNDIRHDIDTDKPEGRILKWYDESMQFYHMNPKYEKFSISYRSYCAGARYELINGI